MLLDTNTPDKPQRAALLRHIQKIASEGVEDPILPWGQFRLAPDKENVRLYYEKFCSLIREREANRAMIDKLAEELKTARRAIGKADALLAELQKH